MRHQFGRDAPTRSADFRASIHYDAWAPADLPQVLEPYARLRGTLGALSGNPGLARALLNPRGRT